MEKSKTFGTIWTLSTIVVIATRAVARDELPCVYKCLAERGQKNLNVSETFRVSKYYGVNSTVSANESAEFKFVESQESLHNCSGEHVTLNTAKDSVQFSPGGYLRWLNGDRIIYSSPENYRIQQYEEKTYLIIQVCVLPCSAGTEEDNDLLCIQKCCPSGFSMGAAVVLTNEESRFECISTTKPTMDFHQERPTLTQLSVVVPQSRFNCSTRSRIVATGQDALLKNGESNECVDQVISDAYPEGIASFTCHDANPEEQEAQKELKYRTGTSISQTGTEADVMVNETEGANDEPSSASRSSSNGESYQEFMYKCGPEVKQDFWIAPPAFQMAYGEVKDDHYNYFPLYNFTLKQRNVECEQMFTLSTSIDLNAHVSGPNLTTLNFTPDGYLTYLYSHEDVIDEIYFHKERFCVANISKTALTVKACKSTCYHQESEKGPGLCIPKCCPFGWAWDNELGCQEVRDDWIPRLFRNRLASEPIAKWDGVMKYVVPETLACYNDSMEAVPYPRDNVRLLTNGKLVRKTTISRGSRMRWQDFASVVSPPFCIDAFWDSGTDETEDSNGRVVVASCAQVEDSVSKAAEASGRHAAYEKFSQVALPVIYFPCALAYVGILVVYLMLWDKQSAHGWTVMAFSLSQLALYVFLMIVVAMAIYSDLLLDSSMHYVCNALGVIHNFAYISTYSWTAVLTFDVWAKLSSMTLASRSSKGLKRFFYYSCFGVGIPTVVVSVASAMEWAFWEYDEDMVVMPGYSDYCVVSGRKAFLYYQGLPSAILFVGNLVFLILTFKSLWNTKKKVEILNDKGSSKSKQSSFDNKMILIAKLMVMMGAFLIFEFITNFGELIGISIYFTFLQVYRVLHAVGLFYLFVCSKKVTKQLGEKYPMLRKETVAKLSRKATVTESMFDSTVSKDVSSGPGFVRKQSKRASLIQFFTRPRSMLGNV